MAVPSIRLRRSSTTGAVPTTSQLALGEVAINTYDGKVFIKKDDGSESIVEVGASSSNSGVTVQDEGSPLSTTATTLNFVGDGVVASGTGTTKTITINGGGGSSSLATAIYTGPSSSQTVDSSSYIDLDIDTAEGTPDAIFSNSNGTVTLGASGTYLAMCTCVLDSTTGTSRWTGELEVRQNSTTLGSVQGGYIRNADGSTETYITLSRIVTTATSTDTINFRIRKIGGRTPSVGLVQDLCTIQIIRLDGIPGIQGPAGNDGADGNDGTDGEDGPSDIPQNLEVGNYTLTSSDNGKHIKASGTGAITIPSSVFSAGNAITIFNDTTSDKTITQGTSVTLRLAGTATTGDRTLATYGLCSLLCVSSNEFVISGAGLT